jgi:RNA polymerase sigma factor (TIGR02999 family)
VIVQNHRKRKPEIAGMSGKASNSAPGGESDVTRILNAAGKGDAKAADELLPLVYQELRKLAASKMSNEVPGQTLQPTALVHEAWLRLTGNENQVWNGRAHFFGAAAEAMRRILIENARRKRAARHGGGQARLDIAELEIAAMAKDDELLAVHDALEKLATRDKQKAELVKLRYFVGLTTEEAAEVLGISVPTADRWWNFSRAWLFEEIEREQKG